MILRTVILLPKTRSSHPISKLLRPVLETKKLKMAFGGVLSTISLLFGVLWLPVSAYQKPSFARAFVPIAEQLVIETETDRPNSVDYASVLPEMTGISQGFSSRHPGVDITAPAGASIYPTQAGRVIKIENSRLGYGRSITIGHENGLESLYAHLGKIKVEEGEMVTKETVLAEVGLTGKTTGYHLHLEIRQKRKTISLNKN